MVGKLTFQDTDLLKKTQQKAFYRLELPLKLFFLFHESLLLFPGLPLLLGLPLLPAENGTENRTFGRLVPHDGQRRRQPMPVAVRAPLKVAAEADVTLKAKPRTDTGHSFRNGVKLLKKSD